MTRRELLLQSAATPAALVTAPLLQFRPAAAVQVASSPSPRMAGDWVRIAGPPVLGLLATEKQEVVDFAIWEALDGRWQAWSCIRHTAEAGATRLFHRWQGASPLTSDWQPMGVAMRADPAFGERLGSMQAPYVVCHDGVYLMFYSSGGRTFVARSEDGKTFARHRLRGDGFGVFDSFSQGEENVVGGGGRDIMLLREPNRWIGYYTANPDGVGRVYARTSPDLLTWDEPRVVSWGGESGTNFYSAECPWVYRLPGTQAAAPHSAARLLAERQHRRHRPHPRRARAARKAFPRGRGHPLASRSRRELPRDCCCKAIRA
jgi:hypothetical protein